ncbi:o-succinylbenzoate synthase [Pontibacillus marinus]|uniref:o-succinylbenzoate synthase n=1 Tax=Pontibacillus marinus BH030004 = DSM 16465 TaxID=1385511 RepID=A0A0A5FZM9_9BACI|nr:o-succinylbenzoate synthase [Pontibacillus marinus]KGX86291.1 O-succinylbenzoate synthase [Pontibacillus marinus BH030004 = DSM 16465]
MRVKEIKLYKIAMKLKSPFRTHAGTVHNRESILIEMIDENGVSGWGEGVAFSLPFYTAETVETSWHMLRDVFLPEIKNEEISHPSDIYVTLKSYQGNDMAKAGLEGAAWDLYAKQKGVPLSQLIGGVRSSLQTGVVLSLDDKLEELIPYYLEEGYERFKIKVRKGKEREDVESVRELAPKASVMFDGNGAYTEEDIPHLVSLDDLGLLMIEQPFKAGDFYLHQQLQQKMNTPICLDESITNDHDAYQAIQLGACKTINIKVGRVGGLTEAIKIHDLCMEHDIPVWCGGMLETGISRAHNIALASLPGFSIPGDISASSRYWYQDVIVPEVMVEDGRVQVSQQDGIGYEIDRPYLGSVTQETYDIQL